MNAIARHLQERGTEGPDSGLVQGRDLGIDSPLDPFAQREYRIVRGFEDDENAWYIISTGPDRAYELQQDPRKLVQFDPTNGTVSRGDIIVPVKAVSPGK